MGTLLLNSLEIRNFRGFQHLQLAWQKEPGKPMGLAITARYLDANAPYAQELLDWIRKLFNLKSA